MLNTLIFILINSFLLLKLLLFIFIKLFSWNTITSKLISIIIMILSIFITVRHKTKKPFDRKNLENKDINFLFKYVIPTRLHNIYNIIIIIFISLGIIVTSFYIRILNNERILDIKKQLYFINNLIQTTTLFENILNIFIFILFLIIYFLIVNNILKFFKFHLIKRHLYLIGSFGTDTFYKNIIFEKLFLKIIINRINIEKTINNLYNIFYFQWCKKTLPINFDSLPVKQQLMIKKQKPIDPFFFSQQNAYLEIFFWHLTTKGHYIIFVIIFFYDFFYNNYQINLMFKILPWTLFFELYLRFSFFINSLWIYYDEIINKIIYSKQIYFWDDNTLKIDDDFYDFEHIKTIYDDYILKDFKKD